jgi:hypothetical protein
MSKCISAASENREKRGGEQPQVFGQTIGQTARTKGGSCALAESHVMSAGVSCPCPLYPQKRTSELSRAMSAMCQKRTLCSAATRSDLSRHVLSNIRQSVARAVRLRQLSCRVPNTSNCQSGRLAPAEISFPERSIKEHTCLAVPLCNVQMHSELSRQWALTCRRCKAAHKVPSQSIMGEQR